MLLKKFVTSAAMLSLLLINCGCSPENQKKPNSPNPSQQHSEETISEKETFDTEKSNTISQTEINRLSEAFGHFLGRNLKVPGINFDIDAIIKGLKDGYAGQPAPMSDQEYEQLMTKVQTQAFNNLSEKNLKDANEFLSNNSKNEKVVVLEPGKLQYIVLQEGQGAEIKEHSSPEIKYSGKFLDGTTFGSSDEAGGTITIPLDQIIPGFNKGVLGMKEGEKRRIFIHPDLGYGTMGHLPPNSLLIFEVEAVKATSPTVESDNEESPDLSLNEANEQEDEDDSDDEDESDEEEDKKS